MEAGQALGEGTRVSDSCAHPFEHSALFYGGDAEFVRTAVAFLEEGLDAGEPALVSVPAVRLDRLRAELSAAAAARVQFVPMEDLGRNPAWIIPAWLDFVGPHLEAGTQIRGIGEPIWPSRTPDELVECERHEALLNLALSDADGFKLLCPYDVDTLPAHVLDTAQHNHRHVSGDNGPGRSEHFRHQVPAQLDTPLTPRPAGARRARFTGDEVWALRRRVADDAAAAGLPGESLEDLNVAVSEALSNSVSYGGGDGELAWWTADERFICEIRDRGYISDPLAGRMRPRPEQGTGRGLWLMHQLCDLVQIRVFADGTQTIRLHLWL